MRQEAERPSLPPLGRLATGPGDEMGFLVSVQSAWMVVLGLAVDEGGLPSLLDVALAHPPHGDLADLQRRGDGVVSLPGRQPTRSSAYPVVSPPGPIRAPVGPEQNAR